MIILDTCILIFDALAKEKLSAVAKKTIMHAEEKQQLFCCDISLWEIAMLVQKKRLQVAEEIHSFLNLMLTARKITVLAITPEIAALSVSHPDFQHDDPADRLIAATAIHHDAKLVTCDKMLQRISALNILW